MKALHTPRLGASYTPTPSSLQLKLSRCSQRIAFTLDLGDGAEAAHAFTRDLASGTLRHLSALGAVVSLEWAGDGRTLLATQPNHLGRPWRVLAADAEAAAQGVAGARRAVHEEGDERLFLELGRTKDWRWGSS
jgi:protease II